VLEVPKWTLVGSGLQGSAKELTEGAALRWIPTESGDLRRIPWSTRWSPHKLTQFLLSEYIVLLDSKLILQFAAS